ncbi:MAG: HAMP domain-containing sensor histidine kinase [Acutalibacter sp.]
MSLQTRLTIAIGMLVMFSILSAYGIALFMEVVFPFSTHIPLFLQLNLYALVIGTVAARLLSKVFFEPITKLREAMRKVADGQLNTVLETKSNSTEIQELYAGFNLMTQELSSTEMLQSDFVSSVSHEIKTPINAIEGYTTLLQSTDNIDEVENEYIERILFNTRRLSTMVSNILLLSKLENQAISTQRTQFSMDEQIRQSILALEPAWTEKSIEFDVILDSITYFGNETLLRHVWDNLIGNAIKFSPEKGLVSIRLYQKEREILFTVDDEGPGFSEEAKNRLFDKFYQEDSSHKQEGNGLGLALVKRILSISKGEITAENRPQGGCRFTVTLHVE